MGGGDLAVCVCVCVCTRLGLSVCLSAELWVTSLKTAGLWSASDLLSDHLACHAGEAATRISSISFKGEGGRLGTVGGEEAQVSQKEFLPAKFRQNRSLQ